MRHLLTYIILGTAFLAISACGDDAFDFDRLKAPRDYSTETATDVVIQYSDSSEVRVQIEGPIMKRYIYRFRIEEEFPEGISVEFYDGFGRANAWLTADYAIRRPNEKVVIARDNVVLFNEAGERIDSHELIWSETDETISTERFVKITRPPDEVIFSRGFKTNQAFTEYELFAVEGEMSIEDLNDD